MKITGNRNSCDYPGRMFPHEPVESEGAARPHPATQKSEPALGDDQNIARHYRDIGTDIAILDQIIQAQTE